MRDQLTLQPAGEDARFSTSPTADRLTRSRWLDLRLAIGLVLILGSVVTGARVIASAENTLPRLAAASDLQPGMQLSPDLVVERQVRLGDTDSAYVAGPVPDGYVVTRPVGAGELIPRTAVAPVADAGPMRHLTIAVPDGELPGRLRLGEQVDIWVLPTTDGSSASPQLVAPAVTVLDTGETTGPFGGGGVGDTRAVTLALRQGDMSPQAFQERVATLIIAARAGSVYLTALPAHEQASS